MSEISVSLPNDNVNSSNQVDQTVPTNTNAQIAGGQSSVSSDTKIKNLEELRKKAPNVYNKMLEGIAMNICNDMKHHQERLEEMNRKARQGG